MKAPTQKQIEAEIKALEESKQWAPPRTMFGDDNHRKIDLQIEYLQGEIDPTSAEFEEEYSQDEQSAILEARDWEEGQIDESPSSGWASFKRKPEKRKMRK